MGWITDGLEADEYDREYSDLRLLKRILHYFSPHKKLLLVLILVVIVDSMAVALIPVALASLIDRFSENQDRVQLLTFIGLIGVLYVISFLGFSNREYLTAKAVHSAVKDLRKDAFNNVVRLDLSFFDKEPTGKISSRILNDSYEFGTTIILTSSLVAESLNIVFMTLFLWNRSPQLTFMVMLFVPFMFIVALSYRSIARRVSQRSQRVIAKVNTLIQETSSGINIAKNFRAEQTFYDEFDDMNYQNYRISLRRQIVFISIFPVLTAAAAFATTMIVYVGSMAVIGQSTSLSGFVNFLPGDQLTIGDWFLFLQGINFFFFPTIQIASFWSQFQLGLAASERVFSIIDTENEVTQIDNKVISPMKGKIEFRDFTFGYTEQMLFKNFNLLIGSGERVAIVGHTGSGKSSLAKLISRYYEYQDGMLLIDDNNIRSLDLREYRKKLAIVSQDVFLWSGSIRENLLYGSKGVENAEERIIEVLKQVDAFDWIEQLEFGLDTPVGERGSQISMGQRQMIAFARILMRDPAILIMDEATASVDPLTEVKIQHATDIILKGRTSIVIAHRLSTIRKMDRILVMREGQIIEQGSHKQLLQQGGHYAELYDTYFRHQSLAYIESLQD